METITELYTGVPPSGFSNTVAVRTGASQGLAPRFEAFPKTGKSPKSSCGVRAKALTPPALLTILLKPDG